MGNSIKCLVLIRPKQKYSGNLFWKGNYFEGSHLIPFYSLNGFLNCLVIIAPCTNYQACCLLAFNFILTLIVGCEST